MRVPLMLLVLLGVASLAPRLRAGDCLECKETKLCKAHDAEEDAVLASVHEALRASAKEERIAALEEVAALTEAHRNAPSKKVAQVLARAMKDEDLDVQAAAARLLASTGQHPETAVRTLVDAVEDLRGLLAGMPRVGRGRDDQDPLDAEQQEMREAAVNLATQVIEGLGRLPDDRSVAVLSDLLVQLPTRGGGDRLVTIVAKALAHLEARDGIESIIQRMVQTEGRMGSRAGSGNEDRRGPGRGDGITRELHDQLVVLSEGKSISEHPVFDEQCAGEWKEWFSANQRFFPARLGKIKLELIR